MAAANVLESDIYTYITTHASEFDISKSNNGADSIAGGTGNDYLFGQGGKDTLNGNEGNDHLYGGAGNDTITGALGADILTGGSGADTFIWNYSDKVTAGSPDVDHITDFDKSTDVIDIRDLLDNGTTAGTTELLKHLSATDTATGVTISIHSGRVNTDTTDVTNQIVLDGVHPTAGVSASVY